MDTLIPLPNRGMLRLSGPGRVEFLQGLVSNDVRAVAPGRAAYACLLTPQGKFLHDFFLAADGESLLIECEGDRRDDLLRKLKMYKLRSQIALEDATAEFSVLAVLGEAAAPGGTIAFADPRIPALGSRVFAREGGGDPAVFAAYDRLRISLAVPDGSRDMEVGKAILLENNIDLLNGIAWDKGCYMGQELTARTRYRGLIKKRLVPVAIAGAAPPIGTPLIENGTEVGEMRTSNGDIGLALLRLDVLRQHRAVSVEGAVLTPRPPAHLGPLLETADA
jgi:folate-binding protein YgfZ